MSEESNQSPEELWAATWHPTDARSIPMLLWCPECKKRHIDVGVYARKPHHTHACQHCGMVWRPALVNTVGVQFLPGFRDADLTGD